ncbi:RHS repeat protein [Metapseudomonas otitidis]|uniref:RHS repeat protein n=1 Tax=Metapseudomonas otitidis TaxID=319939 RepID=UPI00262AA2A0|nr:RHS repeat protein [Pseudomonas otitidis]
MPDYQTTPWAQPTQHSQITKTPLIKKIAISINCIVAISLLAISTPSLGDNYSWVNYYQSGLSTPIAACKNLESHTGNTFYYAVKKHDDQWGCYGSINHVPGPFLNGEVFLRGNGCPDGATLKPGIGCRVPSKDVGSTCTSDPSKIRQLDGSCVDLGQAASLKGMPNETACPIAGNPIVFSTGNKIQFEMPLPDLRLTYNSSDGMWRHNYSDYIITDDDYAAITTSDGKEIYFTKTQNSYTENLPKTGVLKQENGLLTYISQENKIMFFDSYGRLSKIIEHGKTHHVIHSAYITTANSPTGSIELKTKGAQLLSAKSGSIEIAFNYNSQNKLSQLNYSNGLIRHYLYEDSRNPNLLTGITDERGIRYATWTYDDQGRAISSEHAGGAEKVTVAYNADGSSTVTNALGKRTTYRFQTIQGVRRITAIEGEPSANCPNSNATFTYDDRGLVKTRTDNKGHVTTFDYNERGLEVSRTEAYGTPQARTVITEWHPTLFLPVTITEPDRTTRYSYDVQGRLTGQATTQR